MNTRAALLCVACSLCLHCEPEPERTTTRPPVRDVLASFEADRPKESAFNRLSEEEKWEFLRLYLPNRVFHLPPGAWFKFLPDGTARVAALTAAGHIEPTDSVRWEFVEGGGLRFRPMEEGWSMPYGFPEGTFVEPTMSDRAFRFKTPGGEPAMSFNLIQPLRVAPDFLNEREQWPLRWARMYPEGDEGSQ